MAGVAWSWMRSQLYWFTSPRSDLKTLQWRFQQVCEKHYWWKVFNAIESWLWKYIIASLKWRTRILLFNWSSAFACLIHFSQWSTAQGIAVRMNNFIFSTGNVNDLSCHEYAGKYISGLQLRCSDILYVNRGSNLCLEVTFAFRITTDRRRTSLNTNISVQNVKSAKACLLMHV